MRIPIMIFFFFVLIQVDGFGQRKKTKSKPTIEVGSSFSYNPIREYYSFESEILALYREIDLDYETPTSGTFEVEDIDTVKIISYEEFHVPFDRLNIGFNLKLIHESFFHEIAITKLNYSKSEVFNRTSYIDSTGSTFSRAISGVDQSVFGFGIRYELGKNFGDPESFDFGFSLAFTNTFHWINRIPKTVSSFPTSGIFYNFEIALIPQAQIALSKQVKLNLKLIPNVLMITTNRVKTNNPNLFESQRVRRLERIPVQDGPELNLTGSVGILYKVTDTRKRRRGN